MIGNECYSFDWCKGNCKPRSSVWLKIVFFSFLFWLWLLVFAFLPGFSSAMLCSVSYGVQQATIWTVNVVSVTAKLFYTLPVLCFLNHECHYHYRWCSILFWSLDSGLCMIKNKIYGTVQSAASVVPAEPAVLPALLLLSSNPANIYFRQYALQRSRSHGGFYHPVSGGAYECVMLCTVDSVCCNLEKKGFSLWPQLIISTRFSWWVDVARSPAVHLKASEWWAARTQTGRPTWQDYGLKWQLVCRNERWKRVRGEGNSFSACKNMMCGFSCFKTKSLLCPYIQIEICFPTSYWILHSIIQNEKSWDIWFTMETTYSTARNLVNGWSRELKWSKNGAPRPICRVYNV